VCFPGPSPSILPGGRYILLDGKPGIGFFSFAFLRIVLGGAKKSFVSIEHTGRPKALRGEFGGGVG